ncbi:MAG TPA: MBL fold metallo-hydrolase [Archangium sp.]|jgi:beta-lactamase superfamily II metal-dependent hydrolase|uniref:ComEC/Rec2 family competence protein n=1 Tax=Archangium sp. TaxID=1872627 RepID=UPI002ED9BCC6
MSRHVRPLLALLGVLLVACEQKSPTPPPGPQPSSALARRYFGKKPDGKLHVYFFDVGQGDATLIISPSGRTVLVDAGPATAGTHLANRLPELLTDKLDLVVLTHPRPDHYSGLAAAVGAVGARRLLEPQLPNTPSDYDALLGSLGGQGVEIFSPAPTAPDAPLRLPLDDDTELTVLWPRAPTEPLLAGESDPELNSIVLRLTYKDTSVLLTGDAREKTESHLLERKAPVRATLLKVGAHGADTASSAAFLAAVHPRAAILSTGARNSRGTPAQSVIERLEATKARVYRTDRDGEVHAVSDGRHFTLTRQRLPEEAQPDTDNVFADHDDPSRTAASVQQASGRVVAKKPEAGKVPVQAGKTPSGQGPDINLAEDSAPTPKTVPTVKQTERPTPMVSGKTVYVASRNRRLFHLPECLNAKRISPKNRVTFVSREEALKQYEPAKDCKP